MPSTLTSKGQTTVPKRVRERLGLKPGDRLEFLVQDDGTALMVPATLHVADLAGCLPPPKRRASLADMDRAIRRRAAQR
ncbi:MAG: AbrB/MazE/SpoVT family DNA-binding domain-containing protein [Rhodospirillales bacterium]|nr:AbrB/MazE/SpoVT family DNA-binding domain-containing protein [Rhodospirillales bacterium]MBI2585308.1 AbrB/MazE/SpoVT family DNA-binding domain-containing protein [Rhodospirillales bacterium]